MKKKHCNKVALITMAPFPKGNVSTLRYTSYLQELAKKHIDPYVLVYCPTNMAKINDNRSGLINGIHYQYATKITWTMGGGILEKILYLFVGLFRSIKYLYQYNPGTIILYGDNSAFVTVFYSLVAKLLGAKYIGDRSEFPTARVRKSKIRLIVYEYKQRLFDGMIIMTKQLCEYYARFSKNSDFVFFLPMTIDVNRFSEVSINKKPYIAVVFGTHNRDGLADSLMCFIDYVKSYDGIWDLLLIGNYTKMPNRSELDRIIERSQVRDRIHINGVARLDEMPQLLADASCLMTTPTEYVSGGFPTKLGEYMLSGTPVVSTIAGELLDYIEPNKDMLMCLPGEMCKVPELLKYVETHPNESSAMAENAKQKAQLFFNAATYVEDLAKFLEC